MGQAKKGGSKEVLLVVSKLAELEAHWQVRGTGVCMRRSTQPALPRCWPSLHPRLP